MGVRILQPRPASPAFGQAPLVTRKGAGNRAFRAFDFVLLTPGLKIFRRKSPKVSGLLRKYSHFGGTMGGDQFDHDCRPRSAVGFAPHVTCTHSRSNVLQPINGACRCRTTKSSARGSSGLEEPATGEGEAAAHRSGAAIGAQYTLRSAYAAVRTIDL